MERLGWIVVCDSYNTTLGEKAILLHSPREAHDALDNANTWCDGNHRLVEVYDYDNEEETTEE